MSVEPQSSINGDPAEVLTSRVISELRQGRAIAVHNAYASSDLSQSSSLLIAAVEHLNSTRLSRIGSAISGNLGLVVTAERARAIGFSEANHQPTVIDLDRHVSIETIYSLAGATPTTVTTESLQQQLLTQGNLELLERAIDIIKLAQLLPALVIGELQDHNDKSVMQIDRSTLTTPKQTIETSLLRISEAPVPLADAEDARVVIFRDEHTQAEHLAVISGDLSNTQSIPVRIHSACLTGDLLASLRCDCGEQLRTAVRHIGQSGGVLLYLDQEGRGIGLANKLRAYGLQDQGLDTIDADQHLGFVADERDFSVAAAILRELGIQQIKLLTNNPIKIEAMRTNGIEVTERIPLLVESNQHNERYLDTKRDRAGHLD